MSKYVQLLLHLILIVETSARCKQRDTTLLASFNTALLRGTFEAVDARTTVLIDQMVNCDVDIFCLQEVWEANTQRRIRKELKDVYPYALSAIDLDAEPSSDGPVCGRSELESVLTCQEQHCPGLQGAALSFCNIISCTEILSQLPQPCLLCLFYNFIITNETRCLTDVTSNYERTFGLMILSTKELKNPMVIPHNSQSQLRGILTASVNGVGDLVCTHLSTPIAPPPLYVGPPIVSPFLYSSYAEQHNDEIMKIFGLVQTMDVPIVMGDFNHGPAFQGDIKSGTFPFYYGLMNARGFVSPYVLKDGRCTACVGNPFIFENRNQLIDHIYITTDTIERVLSAERFYDVVFPSIGVPLSDHYGIKVRLSNVKLNCDSIQECDYHDHCVSEIKPLPPLQVDYSEVCFDHMSKLKPLLPFLDHSKICHDFTKY